MGIFVWLSLLLSIAYSVILALYTFYWNRLETWRIPNTFQATTKVSVLIPARNEANYIEACIQSILEQDYPRELIEIIVLDDHSTDETADIVTRLSNQNIQLLKLANYPLNTHNSFKKIAIQLGIQAAKGEFILTTDADCIVPTNWIRFFLSYHHYKQKNFIAAPVNFYQENNTLERFQSLDFIGMMGITGAGIEGRFMRMCNGANLGYTKAIFEKINGFEGIDHLASGDDMLLMQKVATQFPNQIGYIKNQKVVVHTYAKPTWRSFMQQRIRWASKSAAYPEIQVTLILGIVFMVCLAIFISLFSIPFVPTIGLSCFLLLSITKIIGDYFFLKPLCTFFDRKDLIHNFLLSWCYHTFYIAAIGILANLVSTYTWKGRKVK